MLYGYKVPGRYLRNILYSWVLTLVIVLGRSTLLEKPNCISAASQSIRLFVPHQTLSIQDLTNKEALWSIDNSRIFSYSLSVTRKLTLKIINEADQGNNLVIRGTRLFWRREEMQCPSKGYPWQTGWDRSCYSFSIWTIEAYHLLIVR